VNLLFFVICFASKNETKIAPPPNGTPLSVTGSDVNCRAGPCTDQRVVTVLQAGNRVTSLAEERTACGHTWWRVRGGFGDGWVASQYLARDSPNNDLCFPLKQASLNYISQNYGDARSSGARCHAAIDVMTKSPGQVVAVADGVVTNIFNFLVCQNGWGCRNGNCQSRAVLIYHPSLGKTINYGEVDGDKIHVRVNENVRKGQILGIASYCGMLHFEVYSGRQTANRQWLPPSGRRVTSPGQCHREYMSTKPAQLDDPRPWINDRLRGKFC